MALRPGSNLKCGCGQSPCNHRPSKLLTQRHYHCGHNTNSQFQISGISLTVTIPAGQTLAFDVVFSSTYAGSSAGALSFAQ